MYIKHNIKIFYNVFLCRHKGILRNIVDNPYAVSMFISFHALIGIFIIIFK